MKTFLYGVLLFVFWFLLSGHQAPLLLGLGLFSVVLTVFLVNRMNVIDKESFPLHLSLRTPGYLIYLTKEIITANIDVVKRILSSDRSSVDPKVFEVSVADKDELSRVIYANSITLTPGTVSIELNNDKILVHALSKPAAEDLSAGSMSNAVNKLAGNKS